MFHIAAEFGHYEIIDFIPRNTPAINSKDLEGWTPLHSAALFGHAKTIDHLIQNGAIFFPDLYPIYLILDLNFHLFI